MKNQDYIIKVVICILLLCCSFILIVSLMLSNGETISSIEKMDSINLFDEFFTGVQATFSFIEDKAVLLFTPLASLLFLVLGSILPDEIKVMKINELKYVQQGNLLCIFFICVCCLLFVFLFIKDFDIYKTVVVVAFLVSVPFLFIIQQGGLELLVLFCVSLYIQYFESSNKKMQNLAFLSLGCAVGLRIYPIVFAFLLKKTEKKKVGFISLCFFILINLCGAVLDIELQYFYDLSNNISQQMFLVIILSSLLVIFLPEKLWSPWELLLLSCFLLGSSLGQSNPEVYAYLILPLIFVGITKDKRKREQMIANICLIPVLLAFWPRGLSLYARSIFCDIGIGLVFLTLVCKFTIEKRAQTDASISK